MLLIVLFAVFSVNAFAQHTVTGIVTDGKTSESLPGVNILVKGTAQGTATDTEGAYKITVSSSSDTLVFSYMGYRNEEIPIKGRTKVNVSLQPQALMGEDVVVVGYGTQRKEDLTSAVSSVGSEELIKSSPKDVASLVQGKVSGLEISTPSGDPTQENEIKLRGTTTLEASSAPLVLIDGVPGDLGTVAPEDVESVNVLKDGSAAAIYGSRGSNGVILITTKKHQPGQPVTIQYDGYVSSEQIVKRPDFLDAGDYRNLIDEGYDFTDYGYDTDWQDQVLRNPVSHTHNLSFSGGNEATSYTATINYKNSQGIFKRSDNEEATGRININHSMFDGEIQADLNLISRMQNYWTGGDGTSFNNYVWRQALIRNPTDRVKNDEGNWQERTGYFYDNPMGLLNESDGKNEERELRMNGTLTWNPLDNLSLKLMGSSTRWTEIRGYSESFQHVSTVNEGLDGYASRGLASNVDQLLEFTGTYDNTFKNHDFSLLGGYSYQNVTNEGFWMTNYDFPTDLFDYNSMESGNALTEGQANMNSDKSSYKLIGFFSRLNYNWSNRYLLMASVRYEGNSKFGADNKWGVFPAVSVGWRINQESFMDDLSFISDLKLRAGYGVTGIAPSDPYQSLTSFSYGDRFYNNGEWVQGITPSQNPNPDLRWERKEEINLGIDFGLMEDRISGNIDVYRRDTKDMLWNYDVPVPPYLYNSILANVGQMRNEGIEVKLDFDVVQSKDFTWSTNINYSTNRNKLVTLSNELYETTNDYFYAGYTGEPVQMPTHRVDIGGPIGNFYGFESVDIDENGEWIVLNSDGDRVPIDDVNEDDRRVLGNGIPNHNLAWNHTLRYKNFDLNVNMRGAFDFQILNFQRMFYENPTVTQYNMLESAFDKVYGKHQLNYDLAYTSYYLEDGDYWKIDNVTLGYTFDVSTLDLISRARVYVSGRNLYTITGYKGMDPEVSTNGLDPGNDPRDKYPTTRTFTVGLNLTF